MPIAYFDTSALVKLVIEEDGSDLAAELWDGSDTAVASRLAHVEVCAALAAAGRNRQFSDTGLDAALDAWADYWASILPVELTPAVERQAGLLARQHALRGADAVHLASALAFPSADLVVAVWDKRLSAAARVAGLAVCPTAFGPS